MYDCIVSIAEKESRLCKNIAKFLQNLPFLLAKFCILDAKFEKIFVQKTAGTDLSLALFVWLEPAGIFVLSPLYLA